METEQQAYEIPGQQLRWRVNQLQQQGFPFQVQPAGGGVYIVIVQQPPQVNPFAYEPVRPRQAWPAWDSANVLRWVMVVGVAAMLLGVLYLVLSRGAAEQPSPAETPATVWDWFDGLRLPWEPDAAPAAPTTPAKVQQDTGWQWPWESAAAGLADAAESVQGTVTLVSASILAVLVLLIVLALVRRRR